MKWGKRQGALWMRRTTFELVFIPVCNLKITNELNMFFNCGMKLEDLEKTHTERHQLRYEVGCLCAVR